MDFAVQPISFNELNSTNDPSGRNASTFNHHKSISSTAATPALQPAHDTVKLSVTSQIEALKQRGASTFEIATKLGLSIADVNQALHITGAVTAAQAAIATPVKALSAVR